MRTGDVVRRITSSAVDGFHEFPPELMTRIRHDHRSPAWRGSAVVGLRPLSHRPRRSPTPAASSGGEAGNADHRRAASRGARKSA